MRLSIARTRSRSKTPGARPSGLRVYHLRRHQAVGPLQGTHQRQPFHDRTGAPLPGAHGGVEDTGVGIAEVAEHLSSGHGAPVPLGLRQQSPEAGRQRFQRPPVGDRRHQAAAS
ncbi:MAG: hypothetical protein ACHQ2E_07530, partial [Gemmatimonadales bacterium]